MQSNQMRTIDLYKFVKHGEFGGITLGMSRGEILSIFPEPDNWMNSYQMDNSPIWQYGNFELHFNDKNILYLIFNDYVNKLSTGKNLNFNRWIFTNRKKLRFQEIMDKLNEEEATFETIEHWSHKALKIIDSGVILTFTGEEIVTHDRFAEGFQFVNHEEEKLILGSIEKSTMII